jgi:protein phosphatase
MKSCYITDAGMVRSHNEDSVTIVKNMMGEHMLIVADGMGGHRAGEIASGIAVSHLSERFKALSSIGSKLDAINWLDENVAIINAEIVKYANNNPECLGMGTTLVTAILTDEFLIFGNIGDSSGFVLKNGKLHKVTKDHTLVNVLVDAGDLTPEEAANHPKKNVLMKALGVSDHQEIDRFDVESPIDAILLASDGLTNMLSNEQIENILNDDNLDIESKLVKLVRKCNSRGGTDNVSVAYLVKESND